MAHYTAINCPQKTKIYKKENRNGPSKNIWLIVKELCKRKPKLSYGDIFHNNYYRSNLFSYIVSHRVALNTVVVVSAPSDVVLSVVVAAVATVVGTVASCFFSASLSTVVVLDLSNVYLFTVVVATVFTVVVAAVATVVLIATVATVVTSYASLSTVVAAAGVATVVVAGVATAVSSNVALNTVVDVVLAPSYLFNLLLLFLLLWLLLFLLMLLYLLLSPKQEEGNEFRRLPFWETSTTIFGFVHLPKWHSRSPSKICLKKEMTTFCRMEQRCYTIFDFEPTSFLL